MTLTVEEQIQLQTAITNAQAAAGAQENNKQRKLQCLSIAHTTLLENKRNLPIEQRQITPADITAFADSLNNYVNA
jgi:recombination DNA repair RAD52 pathway protein